MLIHRHKDVLLKSFYLDSDNITIRRLHDGYYKRYKKHDIVIAYTGKGKQPYPMIHIPRTRRSVKRCHLLSLLRNIPLPPTFIMDHIDGDFTNDTPNNLRITTHLINNRNRCIRSDNTSGITGIRWSEYHKHYVIRKTVGSTRMSRSRKTLEEAKKVLEYLCSLDSTYTIRHGK